MFCSGFISHVSRYTNGWHGNKTEGENQRILCAILFILCLCTNVLGAFMLCELANQKCLIDKTDHLKELLLRNRFGGRKIVFHSLLKTLFDESRELL